MEFGMWLLAPDLAEKHVGIHRARPLGVLFLCNCNRTHCPLSLMCHVQVGKIPLANFLSIHLGIFYKGLYVVARNFFLLLLNCCAWPCLAVAKQNLHTFIPGPVDVIL